MKRNSTMMAAAPPAPAAPAEPTADPPKTGGLFALGQLLRQCQRDVNTGWETVAVLSQVCKPLHAQARTRARTLLGLSEALPPGPIALLRRAQKKALSPIAPDVDVPLQNWSGGVKLLGPGAVALEDPHKVVAGETCYFQLTDSDVVSLAACPALQSVSLRRCYHVTDASLVALGGCSGLTAVVLESHAFYQLQGQTGGAIVAFSMLPALQELCMKGPWAIVDKDIEALSKCKKLRVLGLNGTGVVDVGPLGRCPALERLDLSSTRKLRGGVGELSKSSSLTYLALSYSKVVLDVGDLGDCANLRELRLKWCSVLNGGTLRALAASPSLTSLDLSLCSQLEDADVSQLEGLATLKDLSLEACPLLGRNLKLPPSLTRLNLACMAQITDSSLAALVERCVALTDVSIRDCCFLDEGIEILARLPLKTLDVSECSITTENLKGLPPTVTDLNVRNLDDLDDSGMAVIARLPALAVLDVSSCSDISDEGIRELYKCRSLKRLTMNECGSHDPELPHRSVTFQSVWHYDGGMKADGVEVIGGPPAPPAGWFEGEIGPGYRCPWEEGLAEIEDW